MRELLSAAYQSRRFKELFSGSGVRAGGALQTPVPAGVFPSRRGGSEGGDRGTSHVSLVDAGGNVVSMTTTVNDLLRFSVPNAGFNNGDAFVQVNGLMGSKVAVPGRY